MHRYCLRLFFVFHLLMVVIIAGEEAEEKKDAEVNVIVTTRWPKSERYHTYLETAEFLWRLKEVSDGGGEEEEVGGGSDEEEKKKKEEEKENDREEFWKYLDTIANGLNYSFTSEIAKKLNEEAIKNGIYASALESQRKVVEGMKEKLKIKCNDAFAIAINNNKNAFLYCSSPCASGESDCYEKNKQAIVDLKEISIMNQSSVEKEKKKKGKEEENFFLLVGEIGEKKFNELYLLFKSKQEAKGGSLLVRFYSSSSSSSFYQIGGFSVFLDLKNTEYITVDPSSITKKESLESEISGVNINTLKEIKKNDDLVELLKKSLKKEKDKIRWWELKDLSLQTSSYILNTVFYIKYIYN